MALTLYTYPGNFRAFKALIAAQYAGVSVTVPPFRMGVDNKTDEFKAKSPLGKVPILETPEGNLFESNAIARYIARLRRDTSLTGESFFESGQVDSWIDFCTNEVELPATMWVYPILGLMQNNPAVTAKAQNDMKRALALLEKHLVYRTFIVGRKITLADIVLVSALYYPFKMVLDKKARKPFQSVVRWFDTCINQPEFKAVLGDFTICATAQKAPGAPANAAGGKKKQKQGKKQKQQKQQQGKKAKKQQAQPAAEKPKKKAKHPLLELPKSSFVMDAWKKMYSNNPIREVAMPWFFEKLDQEGYSVWFNNYNYNNENTVMFMTANLVAGFMQRTDPMRKFGFGVLHILGKEGEVSQFDVTGAWLFRGQEIKYMLEANPDAEYHTWTKADLSDEATREKLINYWANTDELNGQAIGDTRCFK